MRLHSGAPFWLIADGLEEMGGAILPPTCDVAIIGAGVTGALVADALTKEGVSVLVLDKRAPACGSTAASTSLVSYEIDVSLADLAKQIGINDAARAYQVSARAVEDIATIAAALPIASGFARSPSVLLASRRRDSDDLEKEAELRQRHGLDATYWTPERTEAAYGFHSHGALHTQLAGVLDPVRFTRVLLERAVGRGACLLTRTPALDIRQERNGLLVETPRGQTRAQWVIYAMGYEMPAALRPDMVALHTTYALVTEPTADLGPWRGQCIVWETSRPYFYMRPTEDRRVMIGGADTPFKSEALRDRLMPGRTKRLESRLRKWLPAVETQTAFVWAGTFAETPDGLPFIGPMPSCRQALYALGYGANGITFGAAAARILCDLVRGRPNDDARLFRLDREH
ncbi:MAG TPA: FAD-dependent oxidoreductase [Gemmatimonadales bacterium]|nr:FAD-dependent oxidoreductase [Gemmatimonadales bacterium]